MKNRFNIQDIVKSSAAILVMSVVFIGCEADSSADESASSHHSTGEATAVVSSAMTVDEAIKIVSGDGPPMRGIQALIALAEADEPNVKARLWLGRFGIQSGQLDKARMRFISVLDLEPNHIEATWDLAMLDMEMGNHQEAVTGFTNYTNLNPKEEKVHFFKASCLESMGNQVEALELYRTFLSLTTDSVLSGKVEGIINRLEVDISVVSDPNE
ncbi:MAG TPA: tetratricopeptide repeat protein [Flavobacteriales bacterium]|nr:tetratricopeptide repeat protein [Flavobacteriales bacterium]HHZ97675.1 tetratricopeptide repeat protein [Flavobacteriales bacterium]